MEAPTTSQSPGRRLDRASGARRAAPPWWARSPGDRPSGKAAWVKGAPGLSAGEDLHRSGRRHDGGAAQLEALVDGLLERLERGAGGEDLEAEPDPGPRSARSASGMAARWRSRVAQSPRAAGPVSADAGPSAATSSTAQRARSTKAASSSPALSASRSTSASRATTWLAATQAAAW